jgi:hypothetical protein
MPWLLGSRASPAGGPGWWRSRSAPTLAVGRQRLRRLTCSFAQGKNVSVDAIELYNGTAGPTIPSVGLSNVTNALATGAAQVVLDKVPNDPNAQVFMVVRYSIS